MLSIKPGILNIASSSTNAVRKPSPAFSLLLLSIDETPTTFFWLFNWGVSTTEEVSSIFLDPADILSITKGVEDDDDGGCWKALAAWIAANCTSPAEDDLARGRRQAESGKLREAEWPLSARAATSCALAAISGVGKVPSHILDFLLGSRTSLTHLFSFLWRTPLYIGCRVFRNFFLPVFRLCGMHLEGHRESEETGFAREGEDVGEDDEAEDSRSKSIE